MTTENDTKSTHRPSIVVTLFLLVGILPFMAGLFGIYTMFGVGMPYFGLLFLLYWASIMRQSSRDYLPSIIGSLGGIFLGWTQVAMPGLLGPAGQPASIIVLVIILFCFMRGHIPMIVNNATMLFALVSTIAELKIGENLSTMAASLIIAAAYMGLISIAVHRVMHRRQIVDDGAAIPPL